MKIGKIHKASGALKVLLGLAAAGALLFAACQNIFDLGEAKTQDNAFGYVIVDLGDVARTIRPNIDPNKADKDGTAANNYLFKRFDYKFIGTGADGKDLEIEETWKTSEVDTNAKAFLLPAGTYRLEVIGYSTIETAPGSGTYKKAVTGEYKGLVVPGGGEIRISVKLQPVTDAKDDELGKLYLGFKLPTTAGLTVQYVITLQQFIGDSDKLFDDNTIYITSKANDGNDSLTFLSTPVNSPPVDNFDPPLSINYQYTFFPAGSNYPDGLVPGTYKLTGKINLSDGRYAGFSEAVHILPNMTTRYVKDFSDDNHLAKVSGPEEAIKILKSEILEWVYNKDVLSSKPIEDLGDTIRINYIGEGMSGLTFPIEPQLGWSADSWNGSTWDPGTWSLDNKISAKTITVSNKAVETADSTAANRKYVTFKVELKPVAQYNVTYGSNVVENVRGVTIAGVELSGTTKGLGIGQLTSTAITVRNGAITINRDFAALDTANVFTIANVESKWYNIVIYETVEDQLKAAAKRLEDEIAVTWVNEVRIGSKYVSPMAKDWKPVFEDKKKGADFKEAGEDGIKDTATLYYVETRLPDKVRVNNVDMRLLAFTLPFAFNGAARDDRWDFQGGDWYVTYDADSSQILINTEDPTDPETNKNRDNKKEIGFTPKGGERVVFDVNLVPVAEFYVDFFPDTSWDKDSPVNLDNRPEYENDTDARITADGGKLEIVSKYGDKPAVTFNATNLGGKNFYLGDQTVTLTAVTLETDILSKNKFDTIPSFENVYKPDATPDQTTNAYVYDDVVQQGNGSPYTFVDGDDNSANTKRSARSREYRIYVYRSLENQKKAAVLQLQGENTQTQIIRWGDVSSPSFGFGFNGAATDANKALKYRSVSVVTPTPEGDVPSSNIVYVEKVKYGTNNASETSGVPVLQFPRNFPSPKYESPFEDRSWMPNKTGNPNANIDNNGVGYANATVDYGEYNTKRIPIYYTFRGGVRTEVYRFNLIGAAEYKVSFGRSPRGNPTTGSIEVTAKAPGYVNEQTVKNTHRNTDNDLNVYKFLVASTDAAGAPSNATISLVSPTDGNIAMYEVFAGNVGNILATRERKYSDKDTPLVLGEAALFPNREARVLSRRYDFVVLPSTDSQVTEVRNALKAVQDLSTWGNNIGTTEFMGFSTEEEDTSILQVVVKDGGNISANDLQAPNNPSFLGDDYYGKLGVPAHAAGNATTGKTTAKVRFTPLCDTADQPLEYTFALTAVAKFTVNFLPGPASTTMGDLQSAKGDIQIRTFVPGGNAEFMDISKSVTHSSRNVFFGGIGTKVTQNNVDSKLTEISSSSGNVFRLLLPTEANDDQAEHPYIDGTRDANNLPKKQTIDTVVSQEYIINVYPPLVEQRNQVLAKLAGLKANSDFFNPKTLSDMDKDVRPELKSTIQNSPRPIDNTSEILFLGKYTDPNDPDSLVYPPVQVPTSTETLASRKLLYSNPNGTGLPKDGNGDPLAVDYFELLALDMDDSDPSNPVPNLVEDTSLVETVGGSNKTVQRVVTQSFIFTPIGPDNSTPAEYKIRMIPVVEYTVVYSPNARGEIRITPPKPTVASGELPLTTAPVDPISIFWTDGTTKTALAVLGETTIRIFATVTQFKSVTVIAPDNSVLPAAILSNGTNISGNPINIGATTLISGKYTIQVLNE